MLEDPSTTNFQCSHWGKEVVAQNFPVHGPIHPPLDTVKSSCPFSWETPPKHKVSTSMLHSGDGVLGVVLLFLETRRVELMPNSSILVSSDHITFWQTSDGPVHVPSSAEQPCVYSRILILHSVVNWWFSLWLCLQVINKLLLCSTGLIPDLSHHHWYPTRWDLAWSPRPREIGGDFVFLPFFNNCSNSC